MKPLIVHVAEVELGEETGMGRVAWHWRRACEARGWEFIHIGPREVDPIAHPALFPRAAWAKWRAMQRDAALFLAHEPAAAPFVGHGVRTVVFSHGLERRGWELAKSGKMDLDAPLRLRTRLLFPLWRLRPCGVGMRRADAVLLINEEDAAYTASHYRLPATRGWVFQNGVHPSACDETQASAGRVRILFLGSWLARKGTRTLAAAARALHNAGVEVDWVLAGVGRDAASVCSQWPAELADCTTIIPSFPACEEARLLRECHVFVLPSFFEGQPLALLQAMEAGRCCVSTDCCGQRDFIQHRVNGLLHPAGDATALTALLRECVGDATLRRELGRAAKLSVADRAWPAVAACVAEQLDSMMRSGQFSPKL